MPKLPWRHKELRVPVDGAVRAGSLWFPANPARAVVLMIPGSGPSSRTCDGYFSRIIDHLLQQGLAVAGFDKRGAGESTGSFAETQIATQTEDALMCLEALARETSGLATGVFGHSQGGWVAFELASRRPDLAFAISNSGPAVGPAEQERSLLVANADAVLGQADVEAYDDAVAAARRHEPTQQVVGQLLDIATFRQRAQELPEHEIEWELEISFMRYEPLAALQALTVSTLVIHGEDDELIPVHESIDELTRVANPAIETVLLAEANHRLLDKEARALVAGYLQVVTSFVDKNTL